MVEVRVRRGGVGAVRVDLVLVPVGEGAVEGVVRRPSMHLGGRHSERLWSRSFGAHALQSSGQLSDLTKRLFSSRTFRVASS